MARPQNKTDLLLQGSENYQKLIDLITSMPPNLQIGTFPFDDRDKNIRDVLCHLHEWHLMMAQWYTVGMAGGKPEMPAPGYTWRTTGPLNDVIWEKYQSLSFEDSLQKLEKSHQEISTLIANHSNEELFTKKIYPWTNTTSLGAYFVSSTSSHYDWAIKKIKKYQRELKKLQ